MPSGEDAVKEIIRQSILQDKTIPNLCAEMFKDLAYGLKIVARNEEKDTFELDKNFILDPQKTISQWIVGSFPQKEKEGE